MEPSYGRSDRNRDRNPWLPLIVVGGLVAAVFLVALIVFARDDGAASPTGTLPTSFADLTTVPPTPPTTPPTTVATTPPVIVAPPVRPGAGGSGGPLRTTTTLAGVTDAASALEAFATQASATQTSEIVPIGSDLYAMIVADGLGKLLRWNDRDWTVADLLDPPGSIRSIETADVTGDGTPDFIIGIGGLDQPAGVYGRTSLTFGFLPFNTLAGKEQFIDGLVYRLGKLQSPLRDAAGARTLTWTWTGQMFETS